MDRRKYLFLSKRWLSSSPRHHLAILNIAKQRADLTDPSMAEFVAATAPINAIARSTPGFIWSFDNDDPSIRAAVAELKNDPLILPQLSVWESLESLKHFAFQSGHVQYYKRRHEWFCPNFPKPYTVLWHCSDRTTLSEAFERLQHLKDQGPTEHAFTFASASKFRSLSMNDGNNENEESDC